MPFVGVCACMFDPVVGDLMLDACAGDSTLDEGASDPGLDASSGAPLPGAGVFCLAVAAGGMLGAMLVAAGAYGGVVAGSVAGVNGALENCPDRNAVDVVGVGVVAAVAGGVAGTVRVTEVVFCRCSRV